MDFPATSRNRDPIVSVLADLWDPLLPRHILEVASGSGQHAVYFASRFPRWRFQPTDLEPEHLRSIENYRQDAGENLSPAIRLDVNQTPWPLDGLFDAILAINLIHISPWSSCQALFAEGSRHLCESGSIYLYGAFRRHGQHTAPSNQSFDVGLRQRDPSWGVRCLEEVTGLAREHGFRRERVTEMPANNLSVLFARD